MLAIEGIGAVTSLGSSWRETWTALLAGSRRSVRYSDLRPDVPLATEVSAIADLPRDVDVDGRGPAYQLVQAAIGDLSVAAGISLSGALRVAGSNHGESDTLERVIAADRSGAPGADVPWRGLVVDPLATGSEGDPALFLCSACSTGAHAVHLANLAAKAGVLSRPVLATATDALSALGVAGFTAAGATGRGVCEPFSDGSRGILIGEGAVALLLSPEAEARGRSPLILGCATSCDAGHPTHPDPDGRFVEAAIRAALRNAALEVSDVRAVIAHGTGATANDVPESLTLERMFGTAGVPVTSVKASLGHLMSAAGLLNIAVAVEICRTALVPPTAGSAPPFDRIDLVRGTPRDIGSRGPVLTLCSGFGGNNVAIVVAGSA